MARVAAGSLVGSAWGTAYAAYSDRGWDDAVKLSCEGSVLVATAASGYISPALMLGGAALIVPVAVPHIWVQWEKRRYWRRLKAGCSTLA